MVVDWREKIKQQEQIKKRAKDQLRRANEKTRQAELNLKLEKFQEFIGDFDKLSSDINSYSVDIEVANEEGQPINKKFIKIDDLKSLMNDLIKQHISSDMMPKKSNKKAGANKPKKKS